MNVEFKVLRYFEIPDGAGPNPYRNWHTCRLESGRCLAVLFSTHNIAEAEEVRRILEEAYEFGFDEGFDAGICLTKEE